MNDYETSQPIMRVTITDTYPVSSGNIPDYVLENYVPDELLCEPEGVIVLSDEIDEMYHQVIRWCIIQSCWFYCFSDPQVTDAEYDFWRRKIVYWETEYASALTEGQTTPAQPNGLSPTKAWWNWCFSRYPVDIQALFEYKELRLYFPYLPDLEPLPDIPYTSNPYLTETCSQEIGDMPKFVMKKR